MTNLIGTIAPSMKFLLMGALFGGSVLSTLYFNFARTATPVSNTADKVAMLPAETASSSELRTATFALG